MFKTKIQKWVSFLVGIVVMTVFSSILNISLTSWAAYENSYVNTGNQADDIVGVARTQIGYHEIGDNYTKYNEWFGSLSVMGYNYAWCQTFVAWCANQAEISTNLVPRVSGTVSGMDFFKNKGTWHNGPYYGTSYIPKKGDIIYFKSGSSSSGYHVGIVSDISDGTVYTIEGNSSDKVSTRSYSVSNSTIVGYGCPNYKSYPVPDPNPIMPDPPIISINQNAGKTDDIINITWNAAKNANSYWLHIYRNGEDYINQTLNQELSYSSTYPAGKYTAFIVSCNSSGEALSSIDFSIYNSVPEKPAPYTEKLLYSINEAVNITWNTTQETDSYWLHIYRNGEDYINQSINQDLSYSNKYPAGNYTAYIVSCNGIGETISNVDFTVYDTLPEQPTPKIDKNVYYTDDIVEITWNETLNTEHYWLHSYKNGEEYENKDLYQSLSYSSSYPVGEYTVYIVSFNEMGETLSNITFNVVEKGDINADGELTVSDIITLKKWLLQGEIKLANWKAADINEDGILNIFDYCLMKRMLINS